MEKSRRAHGCNFTNFQPLRFFVDLATLIVNATVLLCQVKETTQQEIATLRSKRFGQGLRMDAIPKYRPPTMQPPFRFNNRIDTPQLEERWRPGSKASTVRHTNARRKSTAAGQSMQQVWLHTFSSFGIRNATLRLVMSMKFCMSPITSPLYLFVICATALHASPAIATAGISHGCLVLLLCYALQARINV